MTGGTLTGLAWTAGELGLRFSWDDAGPVHLDALALGEGASTVGARPLVEVITAGRFHARPSLALAETMVGQGLRHVSHLIDDASLVIVQRDEDSGLRVESHFAVTSPRSLQTWSVVEAEEREVTLLALTTFALRTAAPTSAGRYDLVEGRSEWLGEGVWTRRPVTDLLTELRLDIPGQDGRGRYAVTSTGGWSTGTVLPTGVLVDAEGTSLAWQIEATAGWSWELADAREGVTLTGTGPTDEAHQFAVTLRPGDRFASVRAGIALGDGLDGAVAALTDHRRGIHRRRPVDATLPVVYNDYMNTLMGQPTTEKLIPLVQAAAAAGAEYFCIDAGWFTNETGDYWSRIGVWEEAPTRFTGGLRAVVDEIRRAGMVPGLWLEPEVIALDSPAVSLLPDEAYFQRYGAVSVEARRRHLDLRHPAARAHLDEAVDRLVHEFGIGFFKLDYNIEPGAGTDRTGAAGEGLLGHSRAYLQWLMDAQERHPDLLFENCASGAMRMDYHLLSVAHLQSTSDQMDATRYAAIAAVAPLSIAPEQAGNWAYPAEDMTDGELAVTLVNGLAGRLYLSGFLDRLAPAQRALVAEAVALHKDLRAGLAAARPAWPLGLPAWDDDVLALAYRMPGRAVLFVWNRGPAAAAAFPAEWAGARLAFGTRTSWAWEGEALTVPAGPDAAVFLRPLPQEGTFA